MTRAVVFDLDGTLIDSLPDVTNAANALLTECDLPPLPEAQVAEFVGMGERVFLDRLIAATALDPDAFDDLLRRFIVHYKASTGATRVFPGALEAVAGLRSSGHAIGLCTNKPAEPLESVLTALGLADAFDAVVAGDTLPVRKPDSSPLFHVLTELGATEAVYVGDSLVDANTAANANVPFALFTEGIRTQAIADIQHDAAFSDFEKLPEICSDLMRAV